MEYIHSDIEISFQTKIMECSVINSYLFLKKHYIPSTTSSMNIMDIDIRIKKYDSLTINMINSFTKYKKLYDIYIDSYNSSFYTNKINICSYF